jgi:RNA polymerase sigma-70 factor (ECF subfamily)
MPRAVVPCRPATLPYASSARLRLSRSSHGWPPQDKLGPGKTRHRGTGRRFLNHAGLASPIHPERVRMRCPQDGGRGCSTRSWSSRSGATKTRSTPWSGRPATAAWRSPSCVAIAYRILRDLHQAEDAVQAAYVAAWRDIRSLRDADRFEPWLHRLLTRACYEEARRTRRFAANIRALPVDDAVTRDEVLTVHDRDELERAMARISVDQRAVLVFHHYCGLTLPEIAERLEIPIGTVKSRLHYATSALRAAVDADARLATDPQERPA